MILEQLEVEREREREGGSGDYVSATQEISSVFSFAGGCFKAVPKLVESVCLVEKTWICLSLLYL